MNTVVSIAGTTISKIEYRGQQVVTFAMIDKVHSRVDGTAKRAFSENRNRFTAGEDFFDLTSDEIRTMSIFPARTARGTIISKRGYLKIAKTLGDDKAWEVFDEMIERYFAADHSKPAVAIPQSFAEALRLAADQAEQIAQGQTLIREMRPKTEFYDAFMNADGLFGLQNAGRALDLRPNLFIRWLKESYLFYQGGDLVPYVRFRQLNIFEVKPEKGNDDKTHLQTYITPKGLEYFAARVPDQIRTRGAA